MEETLSPSSRDREDRLFLVVCSSGFEAVARVRSALMFASLAASSDYRAVLFCIQNAVEVMVDGAIPNRETPEPGGPTLSQRLGEAVEAGVEILCCTQVMANKNISAGALIAAARPAGAMTLIELSTRAKGTLCF